jgi:SAM-dependent methyltransferase
MHVGGLLMDTDPVSDRNSKFWDEMCGTNIARELGITDSKPESLKRFDDWFFSFYPYLCHHLAPATGGSTRVLEVGLGYGTVGTYLMRRGLQYTGLDIAEGPVELMNLRGRHLRKISPVAQVGDVLSMTMFPDDTFDSVVAIGSLHHTGDFDRAIAEVVRVAKPGATVVGMVYSLFSLRNWMKRPTLMLRALRNNRGPAGARVRADEHLRWMSDHNSSGDAAPATEYFSRRALKMVLEQYGEVTIRARNLDSVGFLGYHFPRVRNAMMRTYLAQLLGLDLYFEIRLPA